jgi:hypothetical protein
MCGIFSGFGKTCPTDQDLRVPDADKSLPVLESANYNFSVNNKSPEPERES